MTNHGILEIFILHTALFVHEQKISRMFVSASSFFRLSSAQHVKELLCAGPAAVGVHQTQQSHQEKLLQAVWKVRKKFTWPAENITEQLRNSFACTCMISGWNVCMSMRGFLGNTCSWYMHISMK